MAGFWDTGGERSWETWKKMHGGVHRKAEKQVRFEELTIEGRNAVLEAFRSGKTIDKLFVLDGCQDGLVKNNHKRARKQDTIINYVAKERLDQLSETGKHQGSHCICRPYKYAEVEEDILEAAQREGRAAVSFYIGRYRRSPNLGAIIQI